MPSKKTLKKRIRKVEYIRDSWRKAHAARTRQLDQLQDAARGLLHALDNGQQDDLPRAKDTLRGLLPEERARQWWNDLSAEFSRALGEAVDRAIITPIDRDIIERDGRDPLVKLGNPMWVNDEQVEAEREAVEAYSRAHNHDMHPLCRETISPDGTRRGECMGDAA